MDRTRFSHQPTLVKIAVGLTVYNAFVFFEELIVDGYGIWQYLPFYKFGKLCIWDLAALVAITVAGIAWWSWKRSPRPSSFDQQPIMIKIATALALGNLSIFVHYFAT